jgi:predicted metal-dependent peptidase
MVPNKLTKARAILICDHPFFASLLLPMPMEENKTIPTMATDGQSVHYNPEYVDSLTQDEVLFVLAHETLHCVFDHMGRRGSRGSNRWNQAADYVINGILVSDKVGSMPAGGLLNPQLVTKGGGIAEGVYKLIPEKDESKGAGQPGGAMDQVHDAGTNQGTQPTDPAKMAQASADLKVRVVAAKNAAKMQGRLSANLERLVDNLVKPKVDWRAALRKFLSERAKVDFSFARPKRRFLAEDLYLPSLVGEKMGSLVIAVDCSGSVSPKLLTEFASEINAIREDVRPSGLELVYFDSKVCHIDTVKDDEELVIKPRGGGGTAFSPVIKHVNKMQEPPAAVVFLTDLECDDFGKKPAYPVLWCVLEGRQNKAPYGEVLEVSEDK